MFSSTACGLGDRLIKDFDGYSERDNRHELPNLRSSYTETLTTLEGINTAFDPDKALALIIQAEL